MFDWERMEPREYQRSAKPSLIKLTTRSYLTATGLAWQHTADKQFLTLANAVRQLAQIIANSPHHGIDVAGFKPYRPYPVQAVWQPADENTDQEQYKIWLKQPLFINESVFLAAKKIVAFDPLITTKIQFEQLTEGTEIQATGNNQVGTNAEVLQDLHAVVDRNGYRLVAPHQYREVYLDGLQSSKSAAILFRLALDPNVGEPQVSVMN